MRIILALTMMIMSSLSFSQSVPIPVDFTGVKCKAYIEQSLSFPNPVDNSEEFIEIVNEAMKYCSAAYARPPRDPANGLLKSGGKFCDSRNKQNSLLAGATCKVRLFELMKSQGY